jgi:DNA polymerase
MWRMRFSIGWRRCDVEARERLKRYLEQRRELGERELVLDGMTVEDVMKIVGAGGAGTRPARTDPPLEAVTEAAPIVVESRGASRESAETPPDWRAALRASGVDPAPPGPVSKRYEFPRPDDVAPAVAQRDDVAADASTAEVPAPAIPGRAPQTTGDHPASPVDRSSLPEAPAGIVVGTASRDLFASRDARPPSLEELAEQIRVCTKCRLYATATNAVPGEGDPNAELVCVGEAPGANEDASGRPFVGQAGQLLTKILAAINLRREDVFICNVLKHRPPGNRNPMPDEVAACSPYLVQQLEAIRPKVIVAFGTFAAQTLLNTKLPIGKLRGSVHRYYGVPLIVTYHPAALLRNPAWKRPTWEDVQLARRIFDSAARD